MSTHPPLALRWNRLACDAIYYTKTPPTIAARALAMVHTAMYDAWTAYSGGNEISTTTGSRLKRPDSECTKQNREIAFSFAAYRVLEALFSQQLPAEHKMVFSSLMKEIGCKPTDESRDLNKPQGIGNICAKMVIDSRMGDGANQEEDYADYTGFKPANDPPPKRPLKDVAKWQPQLNAQRKPQKCLTPQWGWVRPFALCWGGEFRPPVPVACGTSEFDQQIDDIIQISACLDDEQKIIAEYWAGMHEDKFEDTSLIPNYGYWTVPPVQSCRIAHYIVEKNGFKNANVIKLFFALTNALLDASIAAWDAKLYYNTTRPDSVIHELRDEFCFDSWGGPCVGTVNMEGEGWCPYLLNTPPFPEYVSGHSTFTRAMADIISCFCDSSEYGECVVFPACSSVIEPDCTPAEEITLSWPTLYDAADQAGWSRRYGGIHFEEGDLRGRELGEKVALCVWNKVCKYFEGIPC
jgi:hypothetical protein